MRIIRPRRLMRIVMATEGPRIAAEAIGNQPLGGAETAFALLAQALARRGHAVEVRAGDAPAEARHGIAWAALAKRGGAAAELVLANRLPRLFRTLPRGRRVLWLHNPGSYLRKPRHLLPLLAARPRLVTLGPGHSASLPRWLPGLLPWRPVEIPLAVAPPFDAGVPARLPPPPVAIFTSSPLRGLDWLLDLWEARIHPALPAAELHLYSGAATYGGDARLPKAPPPMAGMRASPPGRRRRSPAPPPCVPPACVFMIPCRVPSWRRAWPRPVSCSIAAIPGRPSAWPWPRPRHSACPAW
jgi:hypothetical protein